MSLRSLGKDICTVDPNFKYACKNGHVRLTPLTENKKYSPDDYLQILQQAKKEVVGIIPPKELQSKSSKFLTFKVSENGQTFFVVFGLGVFGNEGLSYERQTASEIENYIELGGANEILERLQEITGKLDITKVVKNYHSNPERPLDVIPKNVGPIIADLILNTKQGGDVYISLKNITGKTIASHGVTTSFSENQNSVLYIDGFNLDLLVNELDINVNKMLEGLSNYILKVPSTFERMENVLIRYPDNLKDLICAGYGYGYYLVKETKNGSCEISDLTTIEKLNNYIGDIQSAQLYYPYFQTNTRQGKCKSMNIKITTSKHVFQFVLRNRAGGIAPNTLELINYEKL